LRNLWPNSWRRNKPSSGLQKWRPPSKHYRKSSVLLLFLLTRSQERGSSLTQMQVMSRLEGCCPKYGTDRSLLQEDVDKTEKLLRHLTGTTCNCEDTGTFPLVPRWTRVPTVHRLLCINLAYEF
jgi:hypothetical protein